MKVLVLTGPPGVGKLTVANALGKQLGYKVMHNHLTIELLCSLFDWGSKPFMELVDKYRIEMLEVAAKYKIKGVITTYVYAAEADNSTMQQLVRRMKRVHVPVYFVQLRCTQSELERRVTNASRKKFTKIQKVKQLRALMKKWDVLSPIPLPNTMTIDTTTLSPVRTATAIVKHFRLAYVRES